MGPGDPPIIYHDFWLLEGQSIQGESAAALFGCSTALVGIGGGRDIFKRCHFRLGLRLGLYRWWGFFSLPRFKAWAKLKRFGPEKRLCS